ncbi:hypothetical protein QA640_44145 (plasmid) [Bradyrhizobium sp. CB82]|uniref:hypothetical protein n=1 Tax=Bradyrhizobium sp. CB82 TaxID=3039159 RepID=UPI0024B1AF7A|nr:hypothetical protein [Bradyrhizobium sp. CB82]WFU45823.1 hypothetical protein QA640_44145 [Bradyrhizobium sp. CB82]
MTSHTEKSDKPVRLGCRISAWSRLTGTGRVTTWGNIKRGKLKTVDYCGITLIYDCERARLFQT